MVGKQGSLAYTFKQGFALIGAVQKIESPRNIALPIYEYRSKDTGGCPHCAEPFEVFQKVADDPLSQCPECGTPLRKVISAPNLASPSPSLDPKNLEKHGFTQYRKSGKGTYEKTAGKGPRTITKD